MTARRTRSLSELPGHLRVPILRRKDTQRTRDRLAAGLAGMEELRSLREQQQQLVGETVAKAEDKRHERRLGGDRSFQEEAPSLLNNSTLSSAQTQGSPRQPVPHPRSFYRGQSMDSILEEGDGLTHGQQGEMTNGNRRYHGVDCNNNNSDKPRHDDFNKSPSPDQISHDASEPRPALISQKHINQSRGGNETRYRPTQTPRENQVIANPSTCGNGNISGGLQKYSQGLTGGGGRVLSQDAPTPTRRRSLTSRDPPTIPPRQRSMSLDMGQPSFQAPQPQCQSSTLSKNGHIHNRFSSLTSINQKDTGLDNVDFSYTGNSLSIENGHRLSQSMTQINDVGNSSRPTPLKRRGSLTWDSLLKSIGIQNPTQSDEDSPNNSTENIDDQNNEAGAEDDDTFHAERMRVDEHILMNRKKGRSMSFTCSNTAAPLINPACFRMNPSRQNPVVANHDLGNLVNKNDSLETNSAPAKSIHPILRRASIQCEAVLTRSNRVVNPIQDVDVNSFKSPGPLHAVMLQYRGFNSPGAQTNTNKDITKPNKPVTPLSGTQELSNERLPGRTNVLKHPSPLLTKNSSDSTSRLCTDDEGAISPGLSTPDTSGRTCRNVTRSIKNDPLLSPAGENNESASVQKCYNKGVDLSEDANKLVNGNIDVSASRVTPDLAGVSENTRTDTRAGTIPITLTTRPVLRHSLSDVKNDESRGSCDDVMSSASSDSENSSRRVVNCQTEEQYENDTNSSRRDSNCERMNENSDCKLNYDRRNSMKVLDLNCVQNNNKQESNKFIDSSDKDTANTQRNKNNTSRSGDTDAQQTPHLLNDNRQFQCPSRDSDRSGYTSPTSAPSVHNSNDDKLFRPMSHQAGFCQHGNVVVNDADIIRNKRSSIFSEVSVMSDVSSKTPSSSASVFSDVSMISDEGYHTCESTSPDSKLSHLKRLGSVTGLQHVTTHTSGMSNNECLRNSVQNRGSQFEPRDSNGNSIGLINGMPTPAFDNIGNGNFRYEKQIAFDRTAPVVHVNPVQTQPAGLNSNQRDIDHRKPSKQTTV